MLCLRIPETVKHCLAHQWLLPIPLLCCLVCIPYMPLCMQVSTSTYNPVVACSCSHLLACSIWSFSPLLYLHHPSFLMSPSSSQSALHPHYLYVCPPPSYTVSPSQMFFVSLSDVLLHFLTFIFPPSTPTTCHPLMPSHTTPYSHIFSDFFSVQCCFSSLVPRPSWFTPSVFVHNNTVKDWRIIVNANRR